MSRARGARFLRGVLALLATGVAACNGEDPNLGASDGGTQAATESLSFSPLADVLSKYPYPAGETPGLVILDENTIKTGNCVSAVLPNGSSQGKLAWLFEAPNGAPLRGLSFVLAPKALVYSDPRGASSLYAEADLVDPAGASPRLTIARSSAGVPTAEAQQSNLDAWITGKTSFIVEFTLANAGYTSDLERVFVQVLRQCTTSDPVPFQMTLSY